MGSFPIFKAWKIGPHFDISSPTEFVALVHRPPTKCQLEAAVPTLAQLRAITSEDIDELAEMTQLGKLALVLPINIVFSCLVHFGCTWSSLFSVA